MKRIILFAITSVIVVLQSCTDNKEDQMLNAFFDYQFNHLKDPESYRMSDFSYTELEFTKEDTAFVMNVFENVYTQRSSIDIHYDPERNYNCISYSDTTTEIGVYMLTKLRYEINVYGSDSLKSVIKNICKERKSYIRKYEDNKNILCDRIDITYNKIDQVIDIICKYGLTYDSVYSVVSKLKPIYYIETSDFGKNSFGGADPVGFEKCGYVMYGNTHEVFDMDIDNDWKINSFLLELHATHVSINDVYFTMSDDFLDRDVKFYTQVCEYGFYGDILSLESNVIINEDNSIYPKKVNERYLKFIKRKLE